MNAAKLRLILLGALSLIIFAHVGVPALGLHLLKQNSSSVTTAVTHENTSREALEKLERAEKQLKDQKETVEKAKHLFADATSHNYQRQVIEDINAYAGMLGIGISGYSFSDSNGGAEGGTGAAPSAPGAASSAPAPAGPTAPDTTAASGVTGAAKPATVTVNLQSPIEYKTFLKFIKLIQNNVTQFRVGTINFSGGGSDSMPSDPSNQSVSSAGQTSVNMPSITLEVYLKQ